MEGPVSSSSSVASGPLARLLGESFAVLAVELPEAHARMCARLAGRAVEIEVDDERFVAAFADREARVHAAPAGEDPAVSVRIATSRQAILAVIDAELSLPEAVLADEVRVVGELDRLVEAHGACWPTSTARCGARRSRLCSGGSGPSASRRDERPARARALRAGLQAGAEAKKAQSSSCRARASERPSSMSLPAKAPSKRR
jgi:hypothetical protein